MPATTAPRSGARATSDDDLLTVPECAVAFRVCEKTIMRRILAGRFPSVRVAGGWRIPRIWVATLIADAIKTGSVVAEDHGAAWIAVNGSPS
jgi:hypothetical protein